jgi:hypothetical protein
VSSLLVAGIVVAGNELSLPDAASDRGPAFATSHLTEAAQDISVDVSIPDSVPLERSHAASRARNRIRLTADATTDAARRNLTQRTQHLARRRSHAARIAADKSLREAEPLMAPKRLPSEQKSPAKIAPKKAEQLIARGKSSAQSRREKLDKIIAEHVRSKGGKVQSANGFPFKRPVRGMTQGNGWYERQEHMTAEQLHRRQRIQQTLDFYYNRPLNTRDDSPWSMMHHMVAWSVDSRILVGGPNGRNVSTIGWLCANGRCEGERLLFVKDGLLLARTGPGLQGHQAQFLAMLAQSRVGPSQRIVVGDYDMSLVDLIQQEQRTCRPRTELTFKLIGISHYLHTDSVWEDDRGERWDIPRLIREEIRQPINGTTCGGTHRLMGMTYAVRRRQQDGLPVTGEWARARDVAVNYQNMALRMQNRDGSFSSDFWRSAGSWGDINRKLKTSGHILEWLVFSLPHDRLTDPQIVRGVDYLNALLSRNRHFDWNKGPLGHGVRALALYNERVYGHKIGYRQIELARKRAAKKSMASQPTKSSVR